VRAPPLDQVGVLAALVEACESVGGDVGRGCGPNARMLPERPAVAAAEISTADGEVAALPDASAMPLPHRSGLR
jgi:hypothetical protein